MLSTYGFLLGIYSQVTRRAAYRTGETKVGDEQDARDAFLHGVAGSGRHGTG